MADKPFAAAVKRVDGGSRSRMRRQSIYFSSRPAFGAGRSNPIIVISSKTYKRAVDRNKIKRRIRAIFRENKKLKEMPLFIYIKKGTRELTFTDLKKEIESVLL